MPPHPRRFRMLSRALAAGALVVLPLTIAPSAPASGQPSADAAGVKVANRIVKLARKELGHGVHEIPDGSNRAPRDLPLRPRHHAPLLRRALVRVLRLLRRARRRSADRPRRPRPGLRAVDPRLGAGHRQVDAAPAARRADHVRAARGNRRGRVPVEPHAHEHRGQPRQRRAPRLAPLARGDGLRADRLRQPVQPHPHEADAEEGSAEHPQGAYLRVPADDDRAGAVDRLHEPRQLGQRREVELGPRRQRPLRLLRLEREATATTSRAATRSGSR